MNQKNIQKYSKKAVNFKKFVALIILEYEIPDKEITETINASNVKDFLEEKHIGHLDLNTIHIFDKQAKGLKTSEDKFIPYSSILDLLEIQNFFLIDGKNYEVMIEY